MSLYIQHGHGKSTKVDVAMDDDCMDGIIFGARNEKPENLLRCATAANERDVSVFLDPQYYVTALRPASDRYLPEYPYYEPGLSVADFGPRRIAQHVASTLDFQAGLPVTAMFSPTVLFETFNDRWHQIALTLAEASIQHHATMAEPPPLLLSFAFAEEALTSIDDIGRFLDAITRDDWTMAGVYLVVTRTESAYCQRFEASRLANLLYLVHALSAINGLQVVCGYSDFVGLLLRAAGASAFATGWNHGLRYCQRTNFIAQEGIRRQPRPRYSSGPLLNSILIDELQQAFDLGIMDELLSGVEYDERINDDDGPAASAWTLADSQHHHLQTLSSLDRTLTGRPREDFRSVSRWVRTARGLYLRCEREGMRFSRSSDASHLEDWSAGLGEYARLVGYA